MYLATIFVALAAIAGANAGARKLDASAIPGDLRLVPEAQRAMKRLVMGLDPARAEKDLVPLGLIARDAVAARRCRQLRKQLFWLDFELLHGRIFVAAPAHIRFFIAVPAPGRDTGSAGDEEALFRSYLRVRVGWTAAEIARRAKFFRIPTAVPFPRDAAEPLGVDGKDRLVLAVGADADSLYSEPVRRLANAFPLEFRRLELPDVNTEGGDLSLVALPEGGIGLLVGHHRILRYLAAHHPGMEPGKPVAAAWLDEARAAYRRAFFGLEILILGEEELRNPSIDSPELFHADMVVSVIRGRSGVIAFIPSYQEVPMDAIGQTKLPDRARALAQGAYDRAARQFEKRGYRVLRIPFRDHPDRTPVQTGAFVDPVTNRQTVLLGKYPYHLDVEGGGPNRQRQIDESRKALESALDLWRDRPTDSSWGIVSSAIAEIWKRFDAAGVAPNPHFDAQASVYEREGIRVIPVSIFPTGEGGLHCLLLN